jgi:menaquinone-specific isochorismate synthase
VGFASFTFDIQDGSSVVIIPTSVTESAPDPKTPRVVSGHIVDDGVDSWRRGFRMAMDAIAAGEVEKVVLARQVRVDMPGREAVPWVLSHLAVNRRAGHVFAIAGLIGASPELLVRRAGSEVTSVVLAGTASDPDGLKGPTIEEEHRLAAESARRGLETVVDIREIDELTVTHGQASHRGTRIRGVTRHGEPVTDLLAALHPTAAVAGTPTSLAIDLIKRIEPQARARYAGPVGWFDSDGNGAFAVALRCGQLGAGGMTLYAGGGLVKGSVEGLELAETDLKLRTMLDALGIEETAHPSS